MNIGDVITYMNYGALRQGRIVSIMKSQLHVERLDGPMAGSIAWIHKQSIQPETNKEA